MQRFRGRAASANRDLVTGEGEELTLSGDRLRLEQALTGLVDNALRHGAGEVRLWAEERDGSVVMHVTDQGAGFPEDFIAHAFERFSRADQARGRGGAGLGLAIVDTIAKAHGGSAAARNRSSQRRGRVDRGASRYLARVKLRRIAFAAAIASAICAAPAAADISKKEAKRWKPDIASARDFAESRAGHVGFAVFDMKGRIDHHGGGGRAAMASTFKVMLMVAYLRRDSVEDRPLNSYDKSLLKPMIRRSANEPATTIRDMLGQRPIERLADRARMKHFQWNSIWGYCKTSARDQAFFLRNLRRYVPQAPLGFREAPARPHRLVAALGDRPGGPATGWKPLLQGRLGLGERGGRPPGRAAAKRRAPDRARGADRGEPLARLRQRDARGRLQPSPAPLAPVGACLSLSVGRRGR